MVFDKRYFIGFFISVIFIGIMAAVSDLIGVTEVISRSGGSAFRLVHYDSHAVECASCDDDS